MLVCGCCLAFKQDLYCSRCICEGVDTHRQYAVSLQSQSTAATLRTDASLKGISPWRQLRAEVAAREREVTRLAQRLNALAENLEVNRHDDRRNGDVQRMDVESTQRTIAQRKRDITDARRKQIEINDRILHARRVLVTEAVSIFGIRELAGVWTIAGLAIPSPEDLRQYPHVRINAAIGHTLHLLFLILGYLSITPPFVISYPRQTHVGRPFLRANTPFLNTTKYREKSVLWMSSTASKRDSRSDLKHRHFLTAFALLSHTIAYLAWTQGVVGIGIGTVDVGVSATAVLELLHLISRSPTLGVRSHEPGTSMLSHLGFSLDVNTVVDYVTRDEHEVEHGWDIVHASRA